MKEILHHLECIKLCIKWDKRPTDKIPSIRSISLCNDYTCVLLILVISLGGGFGAGDRNVFGHSNVSPFGNMSSYGSAKMVSHVGRYKSQMFFVLNRDWIYCRCFCSIWMYQFGKVLWACWSRFWHTDCCMLCWKIFAEKTTNLERRCKNRQLYLQKALQVSSDLVLNNGSQCASLGCFSIPLVGLSHDPTVTTVAAGFTFGMSKFGSWESPGRVTCSCWQGQGHPTSL